ncbi:SDR family oxidoreductase [Limnobacter humi]|uniref:SDR family oxidoreductase n=1 Tax=Limnobacter humi TaxID=1778671 RepID=A0ABT1WJL4_9BURK|nr:SDR family oxidoreductase [Limnobacter humi]MCQ8897708.1 SDR family oxidoreductase [Limnobacter humi]
MRLNNTPHRTILTGASGGIGRAMAFELAKVSNSLLLLGRQADALLALRDELLREQGPTPIQVDVLAGDLLDPDYLKVVSEKAAALSCNLLINNAGINAFGPSHRVDAQAQTRIVQTNLLAPMLLTNALLPGLLKQPHAQVVQVGSIFGYIGYPGNAAYCASKFGLRGYAQALARENADSPVRVKYFAPRATSTTINAGAVDALNKALKVKSDTPEFVARQLIDFLDTADFERKLGWPEKLFVFLNQLFPGLNDRAIAGQLPVIRQHF